MKIETKFNIGQEVWFMSDNEICNEKITAIHIHIDALGSFVTYSFEDTPIGQALNTAEEKYFFPTKEELLKSL